MRLKNFDSEIRVVPCCDSSKEIRLSSAMSLSPVIRYFAFPRIAVSRIISSSGSRHNSILPFKVIRSALSFMFWTNSLVSFSVMPYFNKNFGRFRTSYISIICCSEITTLNFPLFHAYRQRVQRVVGRQSIGYRI